MINSIEIEATVFVDTALMCNVCGAALPGEQRRTGEDPIVLYVEPCPDCLITELEKGIAQGEENAQ